MAQLVSRLSAPQVYLPGMMVSEATPSPFINCVTMYFDQVRVEKRYAFVSRKGYYDKDGNLIEQQIPFQCIRPRDGKGFLARRRIHGAGMYRVYDKAIEKARFFLR